MQYESEHGITLDRRNHLRNIVHIAGCDVELAPLEEGPPGGKGGNSFVFRITDEDSQDLGVIKISAYHNGLSSSRDVKRRLRFEREIDALKLAKSRGMSDTVVDILSDGELTISRSVFRYFVMPKANGSLADLLENEELSLTNKFLLCHNILEAINSLHEIGIYHRDIKPGNFMMFESTVRAGDLGLCAYRDEDESVLDKRERRIGPFGFLSPEAINRYCASERSRLFGALCRMDGASDVFQLGQLFWFILQGDVPVGQLTRADLTSVPDGCLFDDVIEPMLRFDRHRRATYDAVASVLKELAQP